ncbi:MAG TPA: SDR family oxidoreductase [Flavobacteriales bacterium]|nr:SDR family oxidoreductase [Flavobacteriales bacterium]
MAMIGQNRLVVVTGASTGVGRATAMSLVQKHGCEVIAVARQAELLSTLAAECDGARGKLVPLTLDLLGPDAPELVAQAVQGRRLHGLVNNAGLLIKRTWGEWTAGDVHRLYGLNAVVPLLLAQVLGPSLQGDPPGHVLNIGSMGGFQGSVKFPGLAAYSSSKAALANLTECMAEEWKDQRIHCNCVCLGAVDTAMLREAFPGYKAPVNPMEMGDWLAGFLLDGHKFFNGKVLPLATSTP